VRNNPLRFVDPSGFTEGEQGGDGSSWARDASSVCGRSVFCESLGGYWVHGGVETGYFNASGEFISTAPSVPLQPRWVPDFYASLDDQVGPHVPLFKDNFFGNTLRALDNVAGTFMAPFRGFELRGAFANEEFYGRERQDALIGALLTVAGPLLEGASSGASSLSQALKGLCFVSGTPVHTEDGRKNIDDVKPGDMVWAKDEVSGEVSLKAVVRTFVSTQDAITEIEIENKFGNTERIKSTRDHPFYTQRGWVGASDLSSSDFIVSRSAGLLRVVSSRTIVEATVVYNFEVDSLHTYFVGEQGALVHNVSKIKLPFSLNSNWTARHISDPLCRNGCEEVAAKIESMIGGEIRRIQATDGRNGLLGRYRGANTGWHHHEVVVKDGRVYDAFSGHEGVTIEEFKGLWQYPDGLDFGF